MKHFILPDITPVDALSFLFYQIPQALVDDEAFSELDGWAIILYSLMLNRTSLSIKNGDNFKDSNGRTYIIFTIEEVMKRCKCAKPFAVKIMKQLENIGLIEKKRQGLGKPSLIYVKNFAYYKLNEMSKETPQKSQIITSVSNNELPKKSLNVTSAGNEELLHKVINNDCSNINHNKNNNRNIEIINQNQIYRESETDNSESDFIDMIDNTVGDNNIINTPESISERLHITELKSEYKDREEEVQLIYNIIRNTYETPDNQSIRISKQSVPAKIVKQIYNSLGKEHIEYVLDNLERNGNKYNIKTVMPYIATSLFQATRTIIYKKDEYFSEPKKSCSFDVDDFFRASVESSMIHYDD